MKVLHISTHNENCGIGKYQEQYLEAYSAVDRKSQHDFFPYSPTAIRKMNPEETRKVLEDLEKTVQQYNLVHIQHELSFYTAKFLTDVVSIIKRAGVPLVSTIHTKVILHDEIIGSRVSPFYWRRVVGAKLADKKMITRFLPLAKSDKIIVHNSFTKRSLEDIGFSGVKIVVMPIPVPTINTNALEESKTAALDLLKPLQLKDGDVLLATAGYLNGVKGTFHAVKAMRGLPENYKLAIIGGLHPQSKDEKFLDEIADYIYDYNLSKRVYVTGSPDDKMFSAVINQADILLYPYLRQYASSSAALNNAFSLGKPIIAFPAKSFVEINEKSEAMALCDSFSYYDLIKKIQQQNGDSLQRLSQLSKKYAKAHSYEKVAKEIIELYRSLLASES